MSKIRFTTASGTVYTLTPGPEVWIKTTSGEPLRDALPAFTGDLVREGVRPLVSVVHGGDMPEPAGESVIYTCPPAVGESFIYEHPTLFGCASTPVVSIEEL